MTQKEAQAFALAFASAMEQISNPQAHSGASPDQAIRNLFGGLTTKAAGSSPTYNSYGYNAGGMFAQPGLERALLSAMMLPVFGLQAMLPVVPNNNTNPLYGIVTGSGKATGTNPIGPCDPPKTAGLSTLCTHSAYFGRFSMKTPTIDITAIGKVPNRAVPMDLQLMNTPFNAGSNPLLPTLPAGGGLDGMGGLIASEVQKILFEFAVSWALEFGTKVYTGNPTNNTSGGGYKEFYGMDILFNTGRKDAVTGVLCPAADSIVYDFASANISGSPTNQTALINRMVYIWRNLKFKAKRQGLWPVKWALTMPDQLFYEITAFWPCNYLTNQCQTAVTGSSNVQIQVTGNEAVQMRDEMRAGNFLWLDGDKVDVVIDEAIIPTTANGTDYVAPMYFVPLNVLGRTPVTFLEYFNYDESGAAMDAAKILAPTGFFSTSDNGRFFWTKEAPTVWCVDLIALMEPRLKVLTPQLGARILNIKYTPLMVTDSPWPGDTNYKAGGSSTSPTTWIPTGAPV
jgi:hypothetical protein